MEAVVAAGAGFLLAVIWFDLMFDVQVARGATDEAVESIATYYARVTTAAHPMNRLVALAMLATLGGIVAELAGDSVDPWVAAVSLVLAAVPIGLAGARTVPSAVRLGQRVDDPPRRAELATRILKDHVFCFVWIASLLATQLASVAFG